MIGSYAATYTDERIDNLEEPRRREKAGTWPPKPENPVGTSMPTLRF